MPRWINAATDEEEEEATTSEDEGPEEEEDSGGNQASDSEEEEEEGSAHSNIDAKVAAAVANPKQKISISLGKKKDGLCCHVCGKPGHNAGFIGSVYHDCINKPCYLCKQPGHTTATCPHRIAPESVNMPPAASGRESLFVGLGRRALDGRQREMRVVHAGWQVDAAVLKLHSRRCTSLEFHPSKDNLVLSGDKKGQVAIWDFDKVYERQVYNMHHALTNNIRFIESADEMNCVSASADGFLKVFDLETGADRELLCLNPLGWIHGVSNERNWGMLHGLDYSRERGLLAAGDNQGNVHFVDARSGASIATEQIHKKGNKVNSVHFNPVDGNLMLTGSNDWSARLTDVRQLRGNGASTSSGEGGAAALAVLEHSKVVNSAYFSPRTGRKILTTCIDNRHDFNRYLTPFRAEWDPKDPGERLFVIGRYISESLGGIALHPIDLFDAATGRVVCQLSDFNLTTICPVNKPHPRIDVIISEEEATRAAERAEQNASNALPGSTHFVFYDADPDVGRKKKRGGAKGIEQEPEQEDGAEEEEEPPAKKARGRKKK